MKLVSWNVNGIRSVLKKGFQEFVQAEAPDVLCLQETKAWPEQVQLELPGYLPFWDRAERKGYSGTAMFSRIQPDEVRYGLGIPKHDGEGRIITASFPGFYLINVYTPNAKRGLERLAYRTQEWDVDFLSYIRKLECRKPVVFCGDLNVAHKEIDLANPKSNENNAGFTPEERHSFDNIVAAGFVDTFRMFTKEGGHYSWWSMMSRAREKNIGWRLDYFCVSAAMQRHVRRSRLMPQVLGSDHCPIAMDLEGVGG